MKIVRRMLIALFTIMMTLILSVVLLHYADTKFYF